MAGAAIPGVGTRRALVVGYFPQWGIYSPRPFYLKSLMANGSVRHLDQINFANAAVDGGHCSLGDPKADLTTPFAAENSVSGRADDPDTPFKGEFHQLQEFKQRYPRIKVLISLEGRARDFAEDALPQNRVAFVASCVQMFVRGEFAHGIHEPGIFDGFDIDWESPQAEDAGNFRALLEEFRRQMNAVRPGLRLSIAVGQSPRMLPNTDFKTLAPLVDQIGVMNYDYAGPWSATTGFLAPLFGSTSAPGQSDSIERSMAAYRAAGVPARKLLMGLPFYGYGWTGVAPEHDGLFQTGHGVRGDQPYWYIRDLAPTFLLYRDKRSQAPWRFDGQTFWTFEDPVSIRYKVSYAARHKLGGVMIWELSGDTPQGELLAAISRSLRHPLRRGAFPKPLQDLSRGQRIAHDGTGTSTALPGSSE